MPDSFFVSNKTRKRKRSTRESAPGSSSQARAVNGKGRPSAKGKSKGKVPLKRNDEELESDATQESDAGGIDDLELRSSDEDPGASGDEDELETPAEKRLRLAKLYLQSVKEDLADGDFDAAEIDKELISSRLKQDVLEHSGKIYRFIASSVKKSDPVFLKTKGHRLPVTSAVASPGAKYLFTAGKEGSIIKWDLRTGKQLSVFQKVHLDDSGGKGKGKGKATGFQDVHGHTDEVLALALSDDGRYLASGGKDKKVVVWDVEKGVWVKTFGGHKDAVSGLAFRKNSLQLFSASYDRTVKIFDLGVMGYVDTLFGHQDYVLDVDSMRSETAVSAGARDRTLRFWKVVDETQLVFRGGAKSAIREVLEGGLEELEDPDGEEKRMERSGQRKFVEGSIDCVAMVDETTFVSGGDSGSICIWTTAKKKPLFTQAVAHGMHEVASETEGIISTPRWITALAALRYSDLIVSGSWDGEIRLWKLDTKPHSLTPIGVLPAPGVVNSLRLITVPHSASSEFEWVKKRASTTANDFHEVDSRKKASQAKEDILLVAGMGQEPRLGRWLRLKEGAGNGSRVYLLRSSTL